MEAMFYGWCVVIGAITLALQSFLISLWQRKRSPPGPFPLPIVGNLFQLRGMPHRVLASLAKIHGPLMSLKLGQSNTVVISSAEVASEAVLKNDLALSGRTSPDSSRALHYNEFSVVWLPPEQPWRDLRKLYNTELFTPQKLDANRSLRLQKVREMLEFVERSCDAGRAVDIGRAAFSTTLNLVSNTLFSIDVLDIDSESSQEFKNLIWRIMEDAGKPNISNFFPVLRFFDLEGTRRRQAKRFLELYKIFDEIIGKRQRSMSQGEEEKKEDVLDAFLRSKFDMQTIKAAFLDIFAAASDTSSNTVEWAMAELLKNPDTMKKARSELASCIPRGEEVDESDIQQLPYLQAVVKETLRLHPPAPLLVPRRAEISVELCGYTVPEHSQVLYNAWAIGRDLDTWSDPDSFRPERFPQRKNVGLQGRNFQMIPFGVGRRICPGQPLAVRMVHLILASLLNSFDWRLPDGTTPNDVDMTEKVGLTMSMANPLLAVPVRQD